MKRALCMYVTTFQVQNYIETFSLFLTILVRSMSYTIKNFISNNIPVCTSINLQIFAVRSSGPERANSPYC